MRWLIDEMLPPALAARLGELQHDAVSVHDVGLAGAEDGDLLELAVTEGRIVVTENFGDFSLLLQRRLGRDEPCVPVVFVRKSAFPRGGGLVAHLAADLDRWAGEHPEPYVGPHWP